MNKGPRDFLTRAVCLLAAAQFAHAATVTYRVTGTATSSAGSSGAIDATISFVTFNSSMTVTIYNNLTGITRDIQTISAIEFVLSGGQTAGSITGRSGLLRTVATNGTWTSSGTFTSGWQLQAGSAIAGCTGCLAGSVDLNTFTGGSPTRTIIGAPNASNLYISGSQTPNNALIKHNPMLATDPGAPVEFVLSMPTVLDTTTVSRLRVFFGTDRTAPLDASPYSSSPEPGSVVLLATGLAIAAPLYRRRANRPK